MKKLIQKITFIYIYAFPLAFLMSLLLTSLAHADEFQPDGVQPPVAEEEPQAVQTVEVEKSRSGILKKHCKCEFNVNVPYRERRENFGWLIGFQWGSYAPTNYIPSFATSGNTFDSYYGGNKNGSAEFSLTFKWNSPIGSIGPNLTVGYFSATHTDTSSGAAVTSNLSVLPVQAGVMLALDTILNEPYIVPYGIAGMYSGLYNETVQGLTVKGNSAFAPFYAVGLMFQLDWIDSEAHDSGYIDFGLENTFIFVEGKSYLQASNRVPDLSTPLQIYAGLKAEF